MNPPYFRGECYSRDSRPLALYNYYDAIVTATALIPDSTNEESIVPEAVSLIVELLAKVILCAATDYTSPALVAELAAPIASVNVNSCVQEPDA